MSYLTTIEADNPFNIWQLNESSGTTATDIINSDNGTTSGVVTVNQTGHVDGQTCYLFGNTNGNQVNATASGLDARTYFNTLECWFNSLSVTSKHQCIIYGGNNNGFGIVILPNGNYGIDEYGYSFPTYDTGVACTFNTWHHVAIAIQPGVFFQVYIDGVLIYTSSSQGLNAFTNGLTIGEYSPSLQGIPLHAPFNGYIQFVAIYQSALTSTQVLTHYNAGAGIALEGVVDRFSNIMIADNTSPQANVDRFSNLLIADKSSPNTLVDRYSLIMIYTTRQIKNNSAMRHYRLRR